MNLYKVYVDRATCNVRKFNRITDYSVISVDILNDISVRGFHWWDEQGRDVVYFIDINFRGGTEDLKVVINICRKFNREESLNKLI